ncbi:MAG: transketolase family protein [Ruminiclostridium sp.]
MMFDVIYDGSKSKSIIKDVFPKVLRELFANDKDVIYLDADLMNSFGTLGLYREMPERCIDCGIQEANMVGVAAGLSETGCKPYVHTFGPFASRRVFDISFVSVAYAKLDVRIIGTDAGVTAAMNGGTHMPFEDIATYCVIPEAMVIDIADPVQFADVLWKTKDRYGLTYIRTTRKDLDSIYKPGSTFELGKANVLKEGSDVTIIAAGIMVGVAMAAAKLLEDKGIKATVIDMFTIKPLDEEAVLKYAKLTGAIVTAENANVIGGLGSMVSSYLSSVYPIPVLHLGVQDQFGEVGPESYLRERFNLEPKDLVEMVEKAIALKNA